MCLPIVTGHALERYIERGSRQILTVLRDGRIDREATREAIGTLCQRGARLGATGVRYDGVRFVMLPWVNGGVVTRAVIVTALPLRWRHE